MAYKDPLDPRARAARRKHYQANKEQYYRRNAEAEKRNRELMNNAKRKPCMDCHIQYEPWIMQFDHRPGEIKCFNISQGMSKTRGQLLREIAKCDVVCANCHADRTWKRSHKEGDL